MSTATWGLPDPEIKPEFYADVTSKRLIAWVVDTAVIVLLCLVIIPFTAFTALFFPPFLYLVVGFAYRVITLSSRSATWGMRLMALEIRQLDAAPLSFGMAVMHTLGYSLSVSFVLPQVVSIVLMMTSPRGQGLTDMVLGTAPVNRSAGY